MCASSLAPPARPVLGPAQTARRFFVETTGPCRGDGPGEDARNHSQRQTGSGSAHQACWWAEQVAPKACWPSQDRRHLPELRLAFGPFQGLSSPGFAAQTVCSLRWARMHHEIANFLANDGRNLDLRTRAPKPRGSPRLVPS